MIQEKKPKIKKSAEKFKKEFKKSVLTAITAAFGFLIALTWKEVITEFVQNIYQISPLQGKFFEATTITLISVLGILIITRAFQEKENGTK